MNNKQLIKKLENANVVCKDCGSKYGVYSVGCSSVWEGVCNVCGETKPVTETRDYAYLMTGIRKLIKEDAERPEPKMGDTWVRDNEPTNVYMYDGKDWVLAFEGKIKEQSKEVAEYMLTEACKQQVETFMEELHTDEIEDASYEIGDITLKLTEDEVGFLNECLDVIVDNHESLCAGHSNERPEDIALFESIEKKITDLYQDRCVKYKLAPAMKAYNAKYGTFGFDNELDTARWEGFRDAFNMNAEVAQ
jgi:hypothetical protein